MNNRLSAFTREAWVAVLLAFVLGLVVGWLFLGYALFPVQFTNVAPSDLSSSYKAQWVQMAADSFSVNHDLNLARDRLRWFTKDEVSLILRNQFDVYNKAGRAQEAARLNQFAQAYGIALTGPAPAPAGPTPAVTTGSAGFLGTLLPLLLGLLLIVVIIGALLLVYSRLRASGVPGLGRRGAPPPRYEEPPPYSTAAATAAPGAGTAPGVATRTTVGPAPAPRPAPAARPPAAAATKSLGTFAATYKFGDDNYDTAFTLETVRGEFLGECGMGISDTIGEGKPDKVTAFDLWLFDKIDVRTVTQILMSEYAFNDQALRARLAQKGELAVAEKGKHIVLETGTLRVDATIVDLVYASTPGLPPNSHFQKLIVQMEPVQK